MDLGLEVESETSVDFGNDSASESCLSGYKFNDEDGLIVSDSEDKNPIAKMARAVKAHKSLGLMDQRHWK